MSKLFEGVRVIDFANNIAGPYALAMMADFGASVIKIERPGWGDDGRGFAPFIEGKSVMFMWLNRGKKSITLDMKNPTAIEIFKSLVKQADVLVESFRPGVVARMGLDYKELKKINSRLIMCSASGFGQTGPYSQMPGYDMIAQAVSGVMDITGRPDAPPTKIGPSLADYCCTFNVFGAISAALYSREKTGKGQYIDLALADCAVALNDHVEIGILDHTVHRNGNHHVMVAPYGVFSGKNESIALGAINQNLWTRLCKLMGKDEFSEHPLYNTAAKRVAALPHVIELIEGWLKKFDKIDEAIKLLQAHGIPCAKINTLRDLENDPQLVAREMIVDFKTPQLAVGKVKARGMHIKFSDTPGEMGVGPELGQHTDEILKNELGYDDEKIAELRSKGVFGAD